MSRSKVILQTFLMLLLVGIGVAVGWYFGPGSGAAGIAEATDSHAGHDHSGHGHAHGPAAAPTTAADKHVPLSREAVLNLGLEFGPVVLANHERHISIPGKIISKPTDGHRTIASPVTGVVRNVAASVGIAVSPDSELFAIDITDQELLNTQTMVLDTLSRLKVLMREADRLQPLVQQGIVGGAKLREGTYERDQLLSKLETLQQALNSYGFGPKELTVLAKQQSLVRSVMVYASSRNQMAQSDPLRPFDDRGALPEPPQQNSTPPTTEPTLRLEAPATTQSTAANTTIPVAFKATMKDGESEADNRLPVEKIHVQVGSMVQRGDALCTLGNYSELLVEGSAFNKDLSLLSDLLSNNGRLKVQFGHRSSGAHGHDFIRDDLEILYIDGEIDTETQTVKFYMRLENEIIHRRPSDDGGEYLTWRFRPGQNVHIKAPVETWKNVLRVPREAVVKQGPNAFAFRRIGGTGGMGGSSEDSFAGAEPTPGANHVPHDHDGDGKPDHDADGHDDHDHDGDGIPDHGPGAHDGHAHAEDIFVEFEPVPVQLLHDDNDFAILASDGKIQPGDIIAQNSAYQLQLASQMDASGSGGHHGHEH